MIRETLTRMFGNGHAQRLAEAREQHANLELRYLERQCKILESTLNIYDNFIDPNDDLFDSDGREIWSRFGLRDASSVARIYSDEAGLRECRDTGRYLWGHNPFARCGHENRISYIVGKGHQYRVEAKPGEEPAEELLDALRAWLKDWIKKNHWAKRQQEIVQRRDRDGEAFLRLFYGLDGILLVRFVEPESIKTPADRMGDERVKYGIEFDEDDAETPLTYFVKDEPVDVGEIQHRKDNVDLSSPRGVPLYYPVRQNLRRAVNLLKTMTFFAIARTSEPWIEKHVGSTLAQVQSYVEGKTDIEVTSSKGDTASYKRFRPGTIRHVHPNTEFVFPEAPALEQQIKELQAELRAVASRLCMPEFMLTSDASNANYSSTMVAEGPAVKMFERMQATMIGEDEEILEQALDHAITHGLVPEDAKTLCQIVAEGPNVQTRNRLQDAQADQILRNQRVMSKETMAARHQLDYQAEKENMEEEQEQDTGFGIPPGAFPFGGQFGQQQKQKQGQEQGDENVDSAR